MRVLIAILLATTASAARAEDVAVGARVRVRERNLTGKPCLFGTKPLFSDGESGAMAGVLVGALGAAFGAAVAPPEKWELVDARRTRVSVARARNGAGLAVSVSF